MQLPENSKRKYFSKAQKGQILLEIKSGGMSYSDLARKYGVHPMTIHKWRRQMNTFTEISKDNIHELVEELKKKEKENDMLKKAIANMAIEKEILQTANDILKKTQVKAKLEWHKK